MQLTSERLIYIKITPAEKADYMRWYTNDDVMKYLTGQGLTQDEAEQRFAKALTTNETYPEGGFFIVQSKDNKEFIGIAKFTYLEEKGLKEKDQVEVGYGMMPDYWGQGYASEMLRCLIQYAKTLPHVRALIGIVNPENESSVKVLTKQGFELYRAKAFGEQPEEHYRLEI